VSIRRLPFVSATRVTHAHPETLSAALVHANAVALALETAPSALDPQAFLAELRRRAREEPSWVDAALLGVSALLDRAAGHVEVGRALGTSPLARESVFSALWAFLSGGASYRAAVETAARLGGDVDSICAMTGALAGALHGMGGIPAEWLRNLDHERPGVPEWLELCDQLSRVVPRDPATLHDSTR
jgi:ADP-ribosylglycohydrolase